MTCFTRVDPALGGRRACRTCARADAPPSARRRRSASPRKPRTSGSSGFNDLQARSAYQPTIHKQGDRYIAYVGHHGGQL